MKEQLLIAGVSTRAMAASAIRAGHRVAAVESFRDLDHPALPDVISLERDLGQRFSAARAAAAATHLSADAVCYGASFENDGDAVALLAEGRTLWGNGPEVLARVRSPILLERVLRQAGLPVARVRASDPPSGDASAWLLKPRRSGGGQRIRHWGPGQPMPRWGYLQEQVPGVPGSLLFTADGREVTAISLTRQLIGDRRFGADGFRYVGNLVSSGSIPLFARQPEIFQAALRIAQAATRAFGLVGINGVDFMARSGVAIATEINPRWTGAVEVVERASGRSLFEWHRDGCAGRLPDGLFFAGRPSGSIYGKAICFARRPIRIGETRQFLGADWVADLPHPGETIGAGQPVCTVFAAGHDAASTIRGLMSAQQRFLAVVRAGNERAA